MSSEDRELLAEGTLISHLVELRQRLLKVVIAIAICFAPCAWFANDLFTIVATPLIKKMPIGTSMSPLLVILPVSANTFVPLLFSVPKLAYQSAPLLMIGAMFASDCKWLAGRSCNRLHRASSATVSCPEWHLRRRRTR